MAQDTDVHMFRTVLNDHGKLPRTHPSVGGRNTAGSPEAPNMKFRLPVSLSLTDTESVHVWSSFATQHTQSLNINVLLLSAHFPGSL